MVRRQTMRSDNNGEEKKKRRVGVTKKKEIKKIITPTTLFNYAKSKNNNVRYSEDFMKRVHALVNYLSDQLLTESVSHAEMYKTKTLMPNSLQYACCTLFDDGLLKTTCVDEVKEIEKNRLSTLKKNRSSKVKN